MLPGYWQQHHSRWAPIPTARVSWSPRWCGAATRGRRAARRARAARLHRLLLQHRTGRSLRRPRLRLLRAGPAQVRPVVARRARPRTSPPTWRATTPSWSGRWRSSPPTPADRRQVLHVRPFRGRAHRHAVAGPAARSAASTAAHRIGGLVLNSPFFDLQGPAILRAAPDVGGAARVGAVCASCRWSASRPPAATAPPCTATTRASSTTTSTGSRSAASPSPSAGSTRSAAARRGCTAGSTSVCPT